MAFARLRSVAPARDRRLRWTLVAAGVFAVAGLLAALVGAAVVAGFGVVYGARGIGGPVDRDLAGTVVLWFAGPAVGGALAGGTAWALSVELLGRRIVATDRDRSPLVYPLLGGVAGVLGGLGLHVVTWEAVLVAVTVAEGSIGPGLLGDLVVAVGVGAYLGLLSAGFGGILTVPALGLAGVALGRVRHLVTTERSNPRASDWARSGDDGT